MPSKLTVRLWLAICMLLPATNLFAQQRTISGKITDANNQPVLGATVTVKGSKVATQTNAEGAFTINVPGTSSVLVISSIGYESREVAVGNNATLDVSLKTLTSNLNEVVITGYTAQRKKDITGAVAVVDVENMRQIPTGTPEQALQGQASGVTIVTSGVPGGDNNIRIRGITSVGSTNPLIIVDGTPASMHDLNVNDIESIQVLKDAGAAAIYGVRGSNGVVVITTKKGRGKVRVAYDSYFGTQRPLKDGFHIANTQETAQAYIQQYINSGLLPANGHKQFGNGTTPVIPDYITPTAGMEGDPDADPSKYDIYDNPITRANKTGTDWFHELFKPANIHSEHVSISAGNDRSSYFFSVGYFDQEGTLIETFLKRYSARINTNFNLGNHFRMGENAYVFYRTAPGIPDDNQDEDNPISMSYRESPIIPIYDTKGNYAGTFSQGLGNASNPVATMRRVHYNKGNNWQVIGNVFAEADLFNHFTVRTSFGGTIDNNYWYNFNFTEYENAENRTNANSFQENYKYNTSWTWTNTLTWSQTFGEHIVKALVGTEAIQSYTRGFWGRRTNYYLTNPGNLTVDPTLWTLTFGPPPGQTTGNLNVNDGTDIDRDNPSLPIQSTLYSQFGRIDYSFADKYLLSGTLRRDGSSVFDPDKRWGVFPSATAGWRISNETFFKPITWVNELKLRAGWGKLGSISNINTTNSYTLYNQLAASSYYDINGSNNSSVLGIYNSQIGNVSTTWEEDIVTNIGFDASILSNKLDISLEWYKKSISGLLFRADGATALTGGATLPFINSGNIQNTGIDASVTYRDKVNSDFNFEVTFTFTSYKNEVKSLPPGRKYYDRESKGSDRFPAFSRMQPGQPLGAFFGLEMTGLWKSDEEIRAANEETRKATNGQDSVYQEAAAPGRIRYRDVNHDGKITLDDRTFFGNPNPDFTTGINLAANYKNFDFSMFLYASVGNDNINYVRYWTDFPQVFDGAVSKDAVYNSWTPQNPGAKVPRLERSANFSNTTQFNSYYLEKGSFLKCRSMILGYNLPASLLSRFKIEKLRLYVQAANLFTITKYTGLDPELTTSNMNDNSNFGIDFGNYPNNQKSYMVGVNLSF